MDKEKKLLIPPIPSVPFNMGMPAGIPVVITDPMGSYTGTPENPEEIPVQDADDL